MEKTPDQLKLAFALWTRQAVQELIQLRFSIRMPIRTVGEYLKRWGLYSAKAVKNMRMNNARPPCRRGSRRSIPRLRSGPNTKGRRSTGGGRGPEFRSDCQHGRGYAPKGKTPVIRLSAKRASLNMISSITNQGEGTIHGVPGHHEREGVDDIPQATHQRGRSEDFFSFWITSASIMPEWFKSLAHQVHEAHRTLFSPRLCPRIESR